MNESIVKLTEEIAQKMNATFASSDFQNAVKAIKEASDEDTGTFRMCISTDDVDRHGEIVVQEGIKTERYLANPIVLWGHNSYDIPVGITTKLVMESDGTKKKTIAEGKFAPTEQGQTLRKLYDAGILNTSSIGFIPTQYEGNKITECELLEWSFVCIPANPYASAVRSLGLSLRELVAKGIMELKQGEKVITRKEGDADVEDIETEEKEPTAEELAAQEEADKEKEDEEEETAGDEAEDAGTAEDAEVQENNFVITLEGGKKLKFAITKESLEEIGAKFATVAKAGRVLSKANLEKVKSAITALEEVVKLAESDDEGKSHDVSESENDAEKEKADNEAKDFLILRRALQGIVSEASEVLRDAKVFAKDRGIKVR